MTALPQVPRIAGGRASAWARRLSSPAPRFWILVALAFLLTYQVAGGTDYTQSLFTVAAVYAILAVSLDLVAGVTGLYSLGHAGLFALGAYTTTLLSNDHGWNAFALLPVSVIGVGIVGLLIGLLSLRVSGLYFAITTFVFTLLVSALLADLQFTGGLQGLVGPLFPGFITPLEWLGPSLTWATMLCLLAVVVVSYAIRRSPFYSVLLAIRDAEPYAAAAGARTSAIKVAMFGLSAAMVGLAGWVFSFQGFVSPGQFSWTLSVNILVMVILGGINTLSGPIVGAAFISLFPAWVSIDPFWQEILFGALLLFVIVTAPRGFVGVAGEQLRRLGRVVGLDGAQQPATAGAAEPAVPEDNPLTRARVAELVGAGASASNGGPAVECKGVVFSYGEGPVVLDSVDFVAAKGTIHGLIGPNGSGKSTLVDLIAGRQRPHAGSIAINGTALERKGASVRARHGFMRTFQTAVLIDDISCRSNVLVGLYSRVPRLGARALAWPAFPSARRDDKRMREEAEVALSLTGVADWQGAKVGDVPHGVEQLTQFAAACAGGPSTLVLDEPLAGLSPSETDRVRQLLIDLKAAGVTVLLIEHQPRFVFEVCDTVTVLSAGKVVTTGPSAEVRENSRVREVYLGQ